MKINPITECSTSNPCPICSLVNETNLVCSKRESLIINSAGIVESLIEVSGLTASLSSYAVVTIQMWVPHSWSSGLIIQLYGPDGSYITLSNGKGGWSENVFDGTLFTDSASNSVSSYPFSNDGVVSPLKPEDPFSSFRGKNPNGKWKLSVRNAFSTGNGNLNGFILSIQGLSFLFFFFQKYILK